VVCKESKLIFVSLLVEFSHGLIALTLLVCIDGNAPVPVKDRVLLCCRWWYDWSFAHLGILLVTTGASIISCCSRLSWNTGLC